jgi:MFS family permease
MFVKTPYKSTEIVEKRDMLVEFREGQKYIRETSSVLMIILMAGIVGFVGFPLTQQLPVVARDVLAQVGDTEAAQATRNSMLYTAQGIGALIAALTLASFNPRQKGMLLAGGQATFILSIIILSLTRNLPTALLLILLIGLGMVTMLALMNILIQLEVPNNLRGRVFSTYLWALQGVAPFGSLTVGWAAQNWGVPNTMLICGVVCLVAIGAIHITQPELRARVA